MGDSRIIIPVFFGIILLTSFSASQSAFAHGTVDQSCEKVTGANSSIGFGEPQGQTFVPTADNIVGVDFLLSSARDDGDVIVTIRDGIDGSILGTDTRLGPPRFGGSEWIHFDFDSIPLTPGNTYVLQLNEPDFATTPIGGTNFLVDFTQQGCTGDRFFRGEVLTCCDLIYRTYSLSLNPQNSPPDITSFTAPINPVAVNTSIDATVSFTDSSSNTHTVVIDWGDTTQNTVEITDGSQSLTVSHSYTNATIHTLSVTVTDNGGKSDSAQFEFVVVFDPNGGFVTGGGWIDSPIGACTFEDCIDATVGKATFGFVSKYQKGATVPSGDTQFHFKAGNLKFKSSDYEWLTIVIAGAKAQFKGTGTINGEGNYGFMITAIDADINNNDSHTEDKFRIKIWDKNNADTVVYDNKMGAADDADPTTIIGGGSIKIHKP